MFTNRKIVLALLASLTLTSVSTASASQPQALLLNPGQGPGCFDLPRFGFSSFNISGFGERVTGVRWGGIASRMGLESGDIILSLNGFPLSYHGSWNDALREAVDNGGFVQLTVRDVRTGMIATRETYVGGIGHGPVVSHSHSHVTGYPGPITTKKKTMPGNPNGNVGTVQQIQNLVEMFDKKNNP
jgi:hypothetical protein